MADTICFDRKSFYTFIFVGFALIVYVLYKVHEEQLVKVSQELSLTSEKHKLELDEQKSALMQQMTQHAQIAQTAQNAQRFEDSERMMNPFVPPLQRGPFSYAGAMLTVPVSTPSRGEYGPFQQIGYLQNGNNIDQAMPLMGRRIYSNKYEYYTFHHNNPTIKIPIVTKAGSEIYDDSTITVPGYTGTFAVKMYELDHPRYIPY